MPYKDPEKARKVKRENIRKYRERIAWMRIGWQKGLEEYEGLTIVRATFLDSPFYIWVPPEGKRVREFLGEDLPVW